LQALQKHLEVTLEIVRIIDKAHGFLTSPFFPMLFKVVAGWNSGIMPPKADKAKKLSESSRAQVGAADEDMSEILD